MVNRYAPILGVCLNAYKKKKKKKKKRSAKDLCNDAYAMFLCVFSSSSDFL